MDILKDAFLVMRENLMPGADSMAAMLDRLENDSRMIRAWPKITSRVKSSLEIQKVLFQFIVAKEKSDVFESAASWPSDWQKYSQELRSAARTLDGFLNSMKPTTGSNFGYFEAKNGIVWISEIIELLSENIPKAIYDELPKSRKRNSQQVAFYKALCSGLNEKIGSPLCEFVSIVTPVVFNTLGEIPESSVRQAWRNEQRAIVARGMPGSQ